MHQIYKMEYIVKDQKQMIEYLHKQAEEHVKTRDMLILMNEELEKEINEKDKVIVKIQKDLETKEQRLNVFEEEFEIEFDETIKIRDRAEMYKAETNKFQKQLEQAEFKLDEMKVKEEITKKLLKSLQADNSALKAKLADSFSEAVDVDRLLEEVKLLKKMNKEKEDTLANVVKENNTLHENLICLEKESNELKEKITTSEKNEEFEHTLGDELGILDPRVHNVSPAFEQKGQNYPTENLLKKIWKLKLAQLEKTISSQKLNLTSSLLHLKEKEYSEIKSLKCACKTYCRIIHQKHNWRRSPSQDIYSKFEVAYSCEKCDEAFPNVDCLQLHMMRVHKEEEDREI